MSALAFLIASFSFSPTLKEPGAPPRLVVTLTNPTEAQVSLMDFESDACFAHFYLELPLTLPDGSKASPAPCPSSSGSNKKELKIARGGQEVRTLDLSVIFPTVKWEPGRYALPASLSQSDIKMLLDPRKAKPPAREPREGDFFVLAPSLEKVRVERDRELVLADGARLLFSAHSHKRTMTGGPPSPLIIHGTFAAPKQKSETFEVRVFPDESRLFKVGGGYTFELVRHEYGEWMELVYFGKR